MNRTELAEAVALKTGLPKKDSEEAVEAVAEDVKETAEVVEEAAK